MIANRMRTNKPPEDECVRIMKMVLGRRLTGHHRMGSTSGSTQPHSRRPPVVTFLEIVKNDGENEMVHHKRTVKAVT